jgi:integrase
MQTFRNLDRPVERMTGHVTDIRVSTCQAYVANIGKDRTASMDLELLRAALNHAVANQLLERTVPVSLPPKSLPRERWLTRSEVAKLVWVAWRSRRSSNGISGDEDDWAMRKHLARWMIVAHYTGTRKAAILNAAFRQEIGRGYMDLEAGLWHRRGAGVRATKKRQPPVPLPTPLLGHLRRWKKNGQTYPVEFGGKPVTSIDKAFRNLVRDCELPGEVIPHTFRHTAITWGMQRGMDPWDAAGYFGINLQTLLEVYGHHHPDHLRDAAAKMARPKKASAGH